tara:strand:- start:172 stop:1215 length:1044 start_codon:yes stop_codon:yes gene_type:complete
VNKSSFRSFDLKIRGIPLYTGFVFFICILSIVSVYSLVIGAGLNPFSSTLKKQYSVEMKVDVDHGGSIIEDKIDSRLNSQSSKLENIYRKNKNITVNELIKKFEIENYSWELIQSVDEKIPRIFTEFLPVDITNVVSIKKRKNLFIATVIPLVLLVNEEILGDRIRVLKLLEDKKSYEQLNFKDREWLKKLIERYELKEFDYIELLTRMDVIPPSLAIAQAAEESGWGTSRFAREGNALFGLYTFKKSAGMRPLRQDDGQKYLVKTYDSLLAAVRSYIHNLNYHNAYASFREKRLIQRNKYDALDSIKLTHELSRYSVRGKEYVETIQKIISSNALEKLDQKTLFLK